MLKLGRPNARYPRRHGLFVRFSDAEWGGLKKALEVWEPVKARRPALVEAVREVLVGWSSELLQVNVSRGGISHQQGGQSEWKTWRIKKAVKRLGDRKKRSRRPAK